MVNISWFEKGVEMSKEGKTNLKIIFISILLLVVMSFVVYATSITFNNPTLNSFKSITTNSTRFNLTIRIDNTDKYDSITVRYNGSYANGTDIKGPNSTTLCNALNASGGPTFNTTKLEGSGLSLNVTCTSNITILPGNWTILVSLNNASEGSNINLTNSTVFVIDTATPNVVPVRPFDVNDPGATNYTAFPIRFVVNVTGNATDTGNSGVDIVYFKVSSSTSGAGTNETVNGSQVMTANITTASGSRNVVNYTTANDGLTISFGSNQRGPGAHSVTFCANDTAGNLNCSTPVNFIIRGGNASDMIKMISGAGASSIVGFSLNFSLENGTPIEVDSTPHFFDPIGVNYTMQMNFTSNRCVGDNCTPVTLEIVGMNIDQNKMSNMSNANASRDPSADFRAKAGGTGYNQSVGWMDLAKFLPDFVLYKFGIIRYTGFQGYDRLYHCNGSFGSPDCWQMNLCPSRPVIGNPANASQDNYTFIADQTGYNSSSSSITIGACYLLEAGNTTIYVKHFSGGAGADDTTPPTVTLNFPANGSNQTNTTPFINITINDTGGSGFANISAFLNITVEGRLYQYPTNISCSPATINATGMICTMNATHTIKENSSVTILVNVYDSSNNSNIQNSSFAFKLDSTAPIYVTWNATNSYNGSQSGLGGIFNGGNAFNFSGTAIGSLGPSLSQSAKQGDTITFFVNWSDTISGGGINSRRATLEILNNSDSLFYMVNATNVTATASANDSWTNFTWVIPIGHTFTEGANITYRINVSDPSGNMNSTNSSLTAIGGNLTKNLSFTFTVNDTALPNVTVRLGTSSLQPANTSTPGSVLNFSFSGTAILLNWSVNDLGGMSQINVSFDNNTVDSGCGEYVTYGSSIINNRLNFQIQYPASGCAGSTSGIVSGSLSNGTHNVTFSAIDAWGNTFRKYVIFNIDNQPPGINISGYSTASGSISGASVNNSNMRSNDTINVTVNDVGSSGVVGTNSTLYATSCNTTNASFTPNTHFTPFNTPGCIGKNQQVTLTAFVNDTSGNANSTTIYFRLDGVAPTFVSTAITNGTSGSNFTVSWNVTDAFMNVTDVSFYLDNSSTYTNTNTTGNMFNISNGTGSASLNLSTLLGSSFISGRHFVVLTANDSVNNQVNTSPIYFTIDGSIVVSDFLNNLSNKFTNNSDGSGTGLGNVTAIELYQVLSNGTLVNANGTTPLTNQTFRLLLGTNVTNLNVTLEVNGTEINWAANFTLTTNNTNFISVVGSVFGKNVLHTVFFDSSLDTFLPNNDGYFGVLRLPLGKGNYSTIYWFEDETTTNTTTAPTTLSACSGTFTRTTSTPCFTDNNSFTLVFVPHFSGVAAVNETTGPYINPDFPLGTNITNSSFIPSFKTSLDVSQCFYSIGGVSNQSMTISGTTLNKTCTGGVTNISHNSQTVINFTTTDGSVVSTKTVGINITDLLAPGVPETTIANSSIGETSVVITWNTSEYTNSTVTYQKTATDSTPANKTDSQLVLSHSISITDLSTDTKYNFTVRSCDFSANCNSSSSQFNFTTAANTSTATAAAAAAGGGGGGGAAAPTTNIETSKAQVFASIAAGSTAVVNVNKAAIAVTKVEVSVVNAVTNAEITVASLKSKPTTEAAGVKVYQYLDLAPKNLGTSDVSKVMITFTVPRKWLADNGVSESDVVLARYSAGSWTELSTTIASSDATSVTYSSESPGFSYYAVTVKAAVAAPKPEEKPVVEEPVKPLEPKKPLEEVKEKVEEAIKPVAEKIGISTTALAWIIIIAVVIIGLVAYFIYARKSRE